MHDGPLSERVWVEYDERRRCTRHSSSRSVTEYSIPRVSSKTALFWYRRIQNRWLRGQLAGSLLRPQDADLKYWFYPAIGDEPAVISFSRVATPVLIEKFKRYDIPASFRRTNLARKWRS